MTSRGTSLMTRRCWPALLVLLSCWGAVGWWSLLSSSAPAWSRAIPFPLAALAAVAWWLGCSRGRSAGQRLCMALVAIATLCGWGGDMGVDRRIGTIKPETLRLSQWTMGDDTPLSDLLPMLERELPHIVILNRPANLRAAKEIITRPLRLRHAVADRGIVILSRFPGRIVEAPSLPRLNALCVRIDTPSGPVDVLALDAPDGPATRQDAHQIYDWIRTHPPDIPVIVAGGMGRNRRDAALTPLRHRLRPAYEVAGYGWPYSWPARLPLFSQDHTWVSEGITVERAAYRWSARAPHLRQFVMFTLAAAP